MPGQESPRGILSPADREYLLGNSEIEPGSQSERNIRSRIRERVQASLQDFKILSNPDQFEDRDFKQVREYKRDNDSQLKEFADRTPDTISTDTVLTEDLEDDLIEMIAFLLRFEPSSNLLESLIQSGIERGLSRQGSEAKVSEVRITIEDPDTIANRITEYFDQGVPLTESEIRLALEQEIRPAEEIAEHVQEYGTRSKGVSVKRAKVNIRDELSNQNLRK